MKHLPNIITLSRIVSAIVLLLVHPFSKAFFVLYTYCGISDAADGFLARKFNLASEKGARLDSVADIVFYGVTAFKIFPELCGTLTPLIWCVIAVAALLRVISYITAAIKYHCFASLHTYMNKLTGFLVFTLPYIVYIPFVKSVFLVIGIVAVLAAAEELIIHITSKRYNANRKALWASLKTY